MGKFTPVELVWKGEIYRIEPHRVMGMISIIEDVLTFHELRAFCLRGAPPPGKLCMAYGAALRYAGAVVGDDEIYAHAFTDDKKMEAVLTATIKLMMLMLPPAVRDKLETDLARAEAEAQTEALVKAHAEAPARLATEGREPANPPARVRPLSRKRSRQRWFKANG